MTDLRMYDRFAGDDHFGSMEVRSNHKEKLRKDPSQLGWNGPTVTRDHSVALHLSSTEGKDSRMNLRKPAIGAIIAGGAVAITTVVMATSGIGPAAAADGPVLFLNNHGSPTDCDVNVAGILKDGRPFSDGIHRQSCDGTLWMPALKSDTTLHVRVDANQPQTHSLEKDFTVKDARDENLLYIDNMTAVCFLVKAFGNIVYTNMSAQGGDCNGS